MTRGKRILSLVGKLLLAGLLSLAALALAFEVYLRHRGFLDAQPANYPCITGDPVLNHVFQPGCEGLAAASALKTARDVTYRTNAFGYRGHPPMEGKRTLVVLGDSYTEGFGLEEGESFPARLERTLGLRDWQVLNGGTLGFTTALYPHYFDRYFLVLRPQWVLLNLDFTDFSDESYFLQIAEYDALGNPVAFPGRDAFPSWTLGYVYSNRSALLRFLHQEVNQWEGVRRREDSQWRMDMFIARGQPLVDLPALQAAKLEGCRKSIEAVARNVLKLRERVRAAGGQLAVHMYPPGHVLKSYASQPQNLSFVQAWDQKHRVDYSWACGVGPSVVDVMRGFAAREKIPFFDSVPFVMAQSDKEKLYYEKDAHWNAEGVARVVNALAPGISRLLQGRGAR